MDEMIQSHKKIIEASTRTARLILPVFLKRFLRNTVKLIKYNYRQFLLRQAVRNRVELKIILGAAETYQKGWFSTNEQWLDVTNGLHWERNFPAKNILKNVILEHVLEHLSPEQSLEALVHVRNYIRPDGNLRIAVPDGYNPNDEYIRHVEVNGIGDDASDHKQLLNIDTLTSILSEAGFETTHVEGYTAKGELVLNKWSIEHGFVKRSRQNPMDTTWDFIDASTSLIVDAKPYV